VTRSDTELLFEIKESAHPVVIEGGGATSYLVTFSPQVKDCAEKSPKLVNCNQAADFLSDTDFINELYVSPNIVVKFIGKVFDSRTELMTSCRASVTSDMITTIAMNSWYAARCISLP
jgi:hypothetical protein